MTNLFTSLLRSVKERVTKDLSQKECSGSDKIGMVF